MIRHASVYDPPLPPNEAGLRVLVMRYWPRGVRRERIDLWLKDAAPSRELVRAFTHESLPWAEFERRYRDELPTDVVPRLRKLEREHGTLTLLCHERIPPEAHCHRQILAGLLSDQAPRRTSRKASP